MRRRRLTPPPPAPRLSKTAARSAASEKARRYVRPGGRVDALAFNGCGRRAREKVVCRFTARGQSASIRTTCALRVPVRGEGVEASARAPKARWHSERELFLTYARAKAALQSETNRLTGGRAGVTAIETLSQIRFSGFVKWSRTRARRTDLCLAELWAAMLSDRSVKPGSPALECKAA